MGSSSFSPRARLHDLQQSLERQLAEYEKDLILGMLEREIDKVSLRELAEFIHSPVGARIGELPASVLFRRTPSSPPAHDRLPPAAVEGDSRTAAIPSSTTSGIPSAPSTAPPAATAAPRDLRIEPFARVVPPATPPEDLASGILDALRSAPEPVATTELRDRLGGPSAKILAELRLLRAQGLVEKIGVGKVTRYALTTRADPPEPDPASQLQVSEFDAAVLEAVRRVGDWITHEDLLKSLRCSEEALRVTLHRLVGQGRLRRSHTSHGTVYKGRASS